MGPKEEKKEEEEEEKNAFYVEYKQREPSFIVQNVRFLKNLFQ